MKLLGIAVLAMMSSAFASSNTYSLKMELSSNGKYISSPRVIVKEGETAAITQKMDSGESFIEVVATEASVKNHKGIMMKFAVGTIGKNGERIITSRPQVFAKENESAQITVSEKNSSAERLSLSVVAKRKSL